jgi:hypothetical protein
MAEGASAHDAFSQPCDGDCAGFLRRFDVDVSAAPRLNNATAVLAIVACNGPVTRGGPQLRCVETARMLTASGMSTVCLHGQGRGGPRGCERVVDQLAWMPRLRAAIFLRALPSLEQWARVQEVHPCALLLFDLMDFSVAFHGYFCRQRPSIANKLAGVIADNPHVRIDSLSLNAAALLSNACLRRRHGIGPPARAQPS